VSWLTHLFFAFTGAKNEAGWPYGLWSGFGGALPDILILTALTGWLHHNNCHQHRCWRLGRHPVGDTGLRVCRRHHPELGRHGRLTASKIAELHKQDRAA
jgi:hypothetical protein